MAGAGNRVVAVISCPAAASRAGRAVVSDFPTVLRVLRRAHMSPLVDEVIVASDSDEVRALVEQHGGRAVATASHHAGSVDRAAEAIGQVACDIAVLIDHDAVAIDADLIRACIDTLLASDAPAALLASRASDGEVDSGFKVVVNRHGEAMYLSRAEIPAAPRAGGAKPLRVHRVVALRASSLADYRAMERTPLEMDEGHGLLRLLENGIKVQVGIFERMAGANAGLAEFGSRGRRRPAIGPRPASEEQAQFLELVRLKLLDRSTPDSVFELLRDHVSRLFVGYDIDNPADLAILNTKLEHIAGLADVLEDTSAPLPAVFRQTVLAIMRSRY